MDKTIFIAGPEPTLRLVYNDVWLPGLYSRRILCFALPPSSSHAKAIQVIERGLEALVKGTPELGGMSVVVPAADHDGKVPWRALTPHKGIEVVVKDMTKTFMSFRELEHQGYPLAVFKDEDFMPIPGEIMPEPQPNAKFQISLIDGGVLLSVCLYHHLTDGNGMNTIMQALGEECAKAAKSDAPLRPRVLDTDRSPMLALKGKEPDLAHHPAYRLTPGIWTPGVTHDQPEPTGPPPEYVPSFFRLEHDKAEALKSLCSTEMPVSTHDAVSALLWRTLLVARHHAGKLDPDVVSYFTVPHNARRHLGLSKEWVGNCVYFVVAEMLASEALQEGSVPRLAARIRTQLNNVNTEVVKDLMELRKADPYGLSWWPVFEPIDRHVVAITSFYRSELLGTHWGDALGDVKHFTSTDVGALGSNFRSGHFVGPKLEGGRGCDVHVSLTKEEADFFLRDELWKQYFRPVENVGNGHA